MTRRWLLCSLSLLLLASTASLSAQKKKKGDDAAEEPARKSIDDYGYRIISERILPDHDDLQDKLLFSGFDPEVPIVVTEKGCEVVA